MPLVLPADKPSARRVVRVARAQRRAETTPAARHALGEALAHGLRQRLEATSRPAVVAVYFSLPSEPPTEPLIGMLREHDIRLLVPELLADNDLSWRDVATGTDLGVAAIGSVGLVVAPALAVDRATGLRLGQGGGSYDRALARTKPGTPVLAVLFDDELVDGVPAEPHDRPVDAVLTPSGGVVPVGSGV